MTRRRWKPTWFSLIVAGSVCAVFLASLYAVPIEHINRLMTYAIGRDRLDNYTLMDRVVGSRQAWASPNTYKIAIVGGSTTRNSIWSADYAAQIIASSVQTPVHILDMAASGQKILTSWALAERAACEGADIVLIGVNLGRSSQRFYMPEHEAAFEAWPPGLQRFLRTTQQYRSSLAIAPISEELRFRAYVVLLSIGTMLKDLGKSKPVGAHSSSSLNLYVWQHLHYRDGRQMGSERLRRAIKAHAGKAPEIYEANWRLWEGTAKAVRECGATPVLIQSPVRPSLTMFGDYADHNRMHIERTERLSRLLDLAVIDPNQLLSFDTSEFYDWGHLGSEQSIKRTTDAISGQIAELIRTHNIVPRHQAR